MKPNQWINGDDTCESIIVSQPTYIHAWHTQQCNQNWLDEWHELLDLEFPVSSFDNVGIRVRFWVWGEEVLSQGVGIWSWYRICFRVGLHEYSSTDPLHSLREVNPIDQPCIMDSVPLVFPRFYDGAIGKFGCEGVFRLIGGYDVCVDAEGCLYEGRTGAWQFYVFCGVCGSMCRGLMVVWWRWWEGRVMSVFGQKLF